VVGVSRLPLTSVEAPLPGFTFGRLGYCFRPAAAAAGSGPLTTPEDLLQTAGDVELAPIERVKLLELILRAVRVDEVAQLTPGLAQVLRWDQFAAADPLAIVREVMNSVTLSPYTDFTATVLAFVRQLVEVGRITPADRVDFLAHLVRQLGRHLTAY